MKIPPFKLERYFSGREFSVPYLLCSSDCETLTIHDLLNMDADACHSFNELKLGYTETRGSIELRREIANLYHNISENHILVHSGAEEAIFNFMNVLLGSGDHIIVHYPCFQSLFQIAESIGCEVTLWKTNEGNGWELNIEFLKNNLRSNTKAVIINCPHNPTGYLMSKNTLGEIVQLSREHNFILFSDEVYRFLEFDENDRLSSLCELDPTGVSLGVMSKSFGLAGLRIGWIATRNEPLYQDLEVFKDYTTICCSAPSEFLATLALKQKHNILSRNLAIIRNNIAILSEFFEKNQNMFNCFIPKAGTVAFPSLANGIEVDQFCHDLVTEAGILLLPGTLYDKSYNNFRIGFGRNNIKEGILRFQKYLNHLKK